MMEYKVMGSIYKDADAACADIRSRACNFACYTPIHTIKCDSIEELQDLFLDEYGEECDRLCGRIYLYVEMQNGWQLITH